MAIRLAFWCVVVLFVAGVLYERFCDLRHLERVVLVLDFTVVGVMLLLAAVFTVAYTKIVWWDFSWEVFQKYRKGSPRPTNSALVLFFFRLFRPRSYYPIVLVLAAGFFLWPLYRFIFPAD